MARFYTKGKVRVFLNDTDISGDVVDIRTEYQQDRVSVPQGMFNTTIPGQVSGVIHITAHLTPTVQGAQRPKEDNAMRNASTKEQVAVRSEMADLIKEAVEAKYGKARIWLESEMVGPLGGVSAQVFGAVEHEGKVVPFAISVYSDDRIAEKLDEQLEQEAEDGARREKLGW